MVWLHGGGFTGGSGNDFDPTELVTENNVVVVTVDYRLGALGFLAAPALAPRSPAGNYGLRDQQAALRRVKANIAHWDGDTRVTLAGQSAGGGSVCAQLRDTGVLSAGRIRCVRCPGARDRPHGQRSTACSKALGRPARVRPAKAACAE